jgi:hypothetical protein
MCQTWRDVSGAAFLIFGTLCVVLAAPGILWRNYAKKLLVVPALVGAEKQSPRLPS